MVTLVSFALGVSQYEFHAGVALFQTLKVVIEPPRNVQHPVVQKPWPTWECAFCQEDCF